MCADCHVINNIAVKYKHPSVLHNEKLYANLNKCTFCIEKILFLGYVVTAQDIKMDEEKVKVIWDWPCETLRKK
jgi:hypothetical protein